MNGYKARRRWGGLSGRSDCWGAGAGTVIGVVQVPSAVWTDSSVQLRATGPARAGESHVGTRTVVCAR